MYKILICDDERDIRNALRIYLTGEGYAVCEADSGLARSSSCSARKYSSCSWTS